MSTSNYFAYESAAERYAKGRPYFHPLMIERLVRFTGRARFENALDVACGTGQSTKALAGVADRVVAIDISDGMLAEAPRLPNVLYQKATAEELPFADDSFDLITVGLAFHWFDQDKFLAEARRVLKPDGRLVIYNHIFLGEMRDCAEFKRWVGEQFLQRYMTPPRARRKLSDQYAHTHGFRLLGDETFDNEVPMTSAQLTGYFLTQSNVIAKVEQGEEKIEDVAAWIGKGVRPFFKGETQVMRFRGNISYLAKELTPREQRLLRGKK